MHEEFLNALRELGGKATNKALREKLGWELGKYLGTKNDLLNAQEIRLQRGRGGTVAINKGPFPAL